MFFAQSEKMRFTKICTSQKRINKTRTEHVGGAVTIWFCIQKVLSWYVGPDTRYRDWILCGFTQSRQVNTRILS
jgi:hypothetical protein